MSIYDLWVMMERVFIIFFFTLESWQKEVVKAIAQ